MRSACKAALAGLGIAVTGCVDPGLGGYYGGAEGYGGPAGYGYARPGFGYGPDRGEGERFEREGAEHDRVERERGGRERGERDRGHPQPPQRRDDHRNDRRDEHRDERRDEHRRPDDRDRG